jgi:TolB-like protein/Tfp pilus assembly protein PilF
LSTRGVEYLSDGVTERLIGSLSQLSRLKHVTGFATVSRYKGQITDVRRVAQTLGVRAVLTGRVSLYGDRMTIGMELVDVAHASRLWSKQYDRTLTNLAALPGELAVDVAEGLRLPMNMDEQHRLSARHTDNSEAYRLFMLGRYYRNKRGVAAKTKSIEYFQQAVEQDPGYALAYAALADAYHAVVSAGTAAHDPKQIYPRAKEAALLALELDDSLADAYVSLGTVKQWFEWDWSGAEDAFKRALALNPRNSAAHHRYGVYLTFMRRFEEGLATLKRAQQLDPLSLDIDVDLGTAYYFAGQLDRAVSQLRHALEIDPQFPRAHSILATIYAQEERRYPEAAAALQASLQSIPDVAAKTLLAKHYTWLGHRAQAEAILNELLALAKRQYVAPTNIAEVYAVSGQNDRAFAWLEAAYEERTPGLLQVYASPLWQRYGIRADPRFPGLIRRMRLPPVVE